MIRLSEHKNAMIDDVFFDFYDIKNLYELQMQLLQKRGIVTDISEAINIWQNHSNTVQASWLFFPSDISRVVEMIEQSGYFTSFEEYCKPL